MKTETKTPKMSLSIVAGFVLAALLSGMLLMWFVMDGPQQLSPATAVGITEVPAPTTPTPKFVAGATSTTNPDIFLHQEIWAQICREFNPSSVVTPAPASLFSEMGDKQIKWSIVSFDANCGSKRTYFVTIPNVEGKPNPFVFLCTFSEFSECEVEVAATYYANSTNLKNAVTRLYLAQGNAKVIFWLDPWFDLFY